MTDTVTRNYNINEFDWDGEEEAVQDQCRVDEVESLIRQALVATERVGDAWIKPSAVDNDRARIAYNVPYSLTEDQKKHMQELVGDVRTITYNASGYHDHPLSHCSLEISEDVVVRKFGNEPFVSVWGNQSRHKRMGHVGAKVVSDRNVPHDWLRNRGVEEAVTDISAFVKARGHLKYRLFLSTHALYYQSLEEVAAWLGGNPDAEFYAIVHRHDKSKGHLNKGELKYTVDENGYVTQHNPLTGFTHRHRSIEPLFHTDSCRVFGGKVGLAWDINKLAGDNYVIKFVLARPDICNKVLDPWDLIRNDREVFVRGDVTVYRVLGYHWYVYHSAHGRVVLEDVELYDRLRRTIAGKERSIRAKSDLMAMCRRLANKNDIISIHQGFAHEVPPEMMTDYVEAAFYADVNHELEVALMYHRENKDAVDALNRFYVEGKAPMDLTLIGKVGRAVATPFDALAGLLVRSSRPSTDLVSMPPMSIMQQLPPDPFEVRKARDKPGMRDFIETMAKGLEVH
eukprot:TRINITY_DN25750_c0_g1_i1.p1 TRINITY_DN25750_c0_g1~~TRINITY_DN25750_c0_g1_i1.p1  ORF type:complete len:520 (+),score=23.56 TRINITY_DN25750_c0_g1_i1:25-1560(+)